jgi:hypothetical protein
MTRSLALVVLVACGSVAPREPDAGVDADVDGSVPEPGRFEWQQNMFGSFPAVTLANDQPYVSANQFAALDLGKGILIPGGGQDVLVARFDAMGQLQWAWRHGGTSDEFQVGMSIDPFGNPAVAGLYRGTGNAGGADLPPTTSFNGFAASYTEAGALRWQLPMTATGELFPRSSSTNGSGNTGLAGHFTGTLNFGVGQERTSLGGRDAFYVRLNDTGGIATLLQLGSTGDDTGNAALFDPLGTVVLIGTFSGQVTFGSGTGAIVLNAGTGRDLFVVRASVQGVPMWAIQGGGTTSIGDLPVAAVLPDGDIVVSTEYDNTFQLTGGQVVTSAGGVDVVLARISSTGTVMWTKTFGGAGQDRVRAIAAGRSGDIALTGEFNGTAGFGGAVFTSAGFIDSFVAKYTGAGDHVWSRATGGPADDRGLGLAVDASGAVYYTGSFHNTVSFGGAPLTAPGIDFNGVLVKYGP